MHKRITASVQILVIGGLLCVYLSRYSDECPEVSATISCYYLFYSRIIQNQAKPKEGLWCYSPIMLSGLKSVLNHSRSGENLQKKY